MAGVRGYSLIVNLPESAKACSESLEVLSGVLKQAIDQLREDNAKSDRVGDSNVQNQLESIRPAPTNNVVKNCDAVQPSVF